MADGLVSTGASQAELRQEVPWRRSDETGSSCRGRGMPWGAQEGLAVWGQVDLGAGGRTWSRKGFVRGAAHSPLEIEFAHQCGHIPWL